MAARQRDLVRVLHLLNKPARSPTPNEHAHVDPCVRQLTCNRHRHRCNAVVGTASCMQPTSACTRCTTWACGSQSCVSRGAATRRRDETTRLLGGWGALQEYRTHLQPGGVERRHVNTTASEAWLSGSGMGVCGYIPFGMSLRASRCSKRPMQETRGQVLFPPLPGRHSKQT